MKESRPDLQPILAHFYRWESETPNAPFLRQPYGDDWVTLSYAEAGDVARRMAAALTARQLSPGSHIGILSKNCAHWILADLAILISGHVSVPFYPNLSPTQLSEVVTLSQIKLLFAGKLETWHHAAIPVEIGIISFPHYAGNAKVTQGAAWDDLVGENLPTSGHPLPEMDNLWTILFTSGTTGQPKGVMLTHHAAASIVANEAQNHDLGIFKLKEHRFFSFLPLNHVAERIAIESACLLTGGCISFGESLATFGTNLQDTRPTFFFAVPRIWSKFQAAVFTKLPPRRLNLLLALPVIGGLVRAKIRKAMGLDAAEVFLTGAAPTSESLKAWYGKLGINLREVYGMTETSGAITVMPWGEYQPGSVGKAVSSVALRIDPDNDELWVKMPWTMAGYFEAATLSADVLQDGWLRTGDKARMDENGFVYIIGRVKDSFKTAKGKFVVPGPIEAGLAHNSMLEQVCVVGSGLPQPLALVVLSEYGKSVEREKVEEKLMRDFVLINGEAANHARLSCIVVMEDEWSVDNDLLTPTLKVRRSVVEGKFALRYTNWQQKKQQFIWELETR